MKKTLFILGLAAAVILGPVTTAVAEGGTIVIKTKGLVCDFCARAIEKKFSRREEVEGVTVDLTSKLVTVRLKEGRMLDDETVQKIVTDSGYNLESIERP